MKKPDRSAFARRHAVPLGIFFIAVLAFSGWSGNGFAGLAGLAGLVWIIAAHLKAE